MVFRGFSLRDLSDILHSPLMDGAATPALLPEILGEPPYREVDLRWRVCSLVWDSKSY